MRYAIIIFFRLRGRKRFSERIPTYLPTYLPPTYPPRFSFTAANIVIFRFDFIFFVSLLSRRFKGRPQIAQIRSTEETRRESYGERAAFFRFSGRPSPRRSLAGQPSACRFRSINPSSPRRDPRHGFFPLKSAAIFRRFSTRYSAENQTRTSRFSETLNTPTLTNVTAIIKIGII